MERADGRGAHVRDVDGARAGDREAFSRLYLELQPKVRHAAYRWVGDLHEAEDTAQDAFLAAYRCLPRLADVAAFEAWLLRIARNRAVDRRRRMLRLRPAEQAHRDDGDGAGPRVLRRSGVNEPSPESVALLRGTLEEMGPQLRDAVLLRYEKGLSCEEIARRSGISLMAVKTRLFRARRIIREALLPEGRTSARRIPRRKIAEKTCVAESVR